MEQKSRPDPERPGANEDESEKSGATYEDLICLFSGNATLETRRRLAKALFDPEHPLSYVARHSFKNEEFKKKWPPDDLPDSIRELLEE